MKVVNILNNFSAFSQSTDQTITLNDVDHITGANLLQLMNGNGKDVLLNCTTRELLNLHAACDKYLMKDLKQACSNALGLHIRRSTVLEIYLAARLLRCDNLMKRSLRFINENFLEIMRSDEFQVFVGDKRTAGFSSDVCNSKKTTTVGDDTFIPRAKQALPFMSPPPSEDGYY